MFGGNQGQNPFGGGSQGQTPTFGQSPSSGLFGAGTGNTTSSFGTGTGTGANTTPTSSVFGTASSSSPGFGKSSSFGQSAVFGQPSSGGSIGQGTSGSVFGAQTSTSGVFGQTGSQSTCSTSGVFGQTGSQSTSSTSGVFGQTGPQSGTGVFGQASSQGSSSGVFGQGGSQPKPAGVFGQTGAKSAFGGGSQTSTFGTTTSATGGQSGFGTQTSTSSTQRSGFSGFGTSKLGASDTGGFGSGGQKLFGGDKAPGGGKSDNPGQEKGLFGKPPSAAQGQEKGLFGKPPPAYNTQPTQMLFGKPVSASSSTTSSKSSDTTTTFGALMEAETRKTLFSDNGDGSKDKPGADLFGKPATGTREQSAGSRSPSPSSRHHGDDAQRSTSPVIRRTIIRKPTEGRGEEGSREAGRGRFARAAPSGGLFGKAISGMTSSARGERREPGREEDPRDPDPRNPEVEPSRVPRRRMSKDAKTTQRALLCKRVHHSVNNSTALRKHFTKFGDVTKIYTNPHKGTATVYFRTHEEAVEAKTKGRQVKPGIPALMISWSSGMRVTTREEVMGTEEGSGTSHQGAPSRRAIIPDVDDELASMAGPADVASALGQQKTSAAKPGPKLNVWSSRSQGQGQGVASRLGGRVPSPTPSGSAAAKPATQKQKPQTEKPEKGVSHVSLKDIRGTVGANAQEKFEILDNRDKIVKAATGVSSKKHADLATATVIVGTCKDMCPEKERYMREYRNGLHVYEMLAGTENLGHGQAQVDHILAVKEYSRSSADQDMPLPHELRPSPVLDMTMNYLVNNILDIGSDGRWADWYDFLWNRTRGIRKDITQQQLCDRTAVSLVEKSARFHIYCSHRLCEEDPSIFDEKINNENLTKCLQTLKEMYADLEDKHSQFCETEAEFRAYVILMNLNEGDILRESQQLRVEVRESPLVKFAMAAHSSLNSNNYVQFFKLCKRATFLCACIMHRYFNQVRGIALSTILKAYKGSLPLVTLVQQLGFEDEEEAGQFCIHHGVLVADGAVPLGKNIKFVQPEEAFSPRRAVNLIETKQDTSVGELVNGGPVPRYIPHTPSSSFDDSGRFLATDVQITRPEEPTEQASSVNRGQEDTSAIAPAQSALPVTSQPSVYDKPPTRAAVPNDIVKEIARELFYEVIDEMLVPLSRDLVQAAQLYLGLSNPLYTDLETETVQHLSRSVVEAAVQEHKQEMAERAARERAEVSASRDRVAKETADRLVAEVTMEMGQSIAEEEGRNVEEQLQIQSRERVTMDISSDLVSEVMAEQMVAISDSVYQSDVVDRLQELEENRKAAELIFAGRFLKKWKDAYIKRVRLKNAMTTFPPAPSMLTQREQISGLVPESNGVSGASLHLGKGSRLTLESPAEVERRDREIRHTVRAYNYLRRARRERAWAPYQEIGCVWRNRNRKQVTWKSAREVGRLKWKLVLSVPESDEDHVNWVRSKFKKGTVPNPDSPKTEVLSLYTRPLSDLWPLTSVAICVRSVTGLLTFEDVGQLEQKRSLLGTSGVIFLLDDNDGKEDLWEEESERLMQLLQAKPRDPPVPLAVISFRTPHPGLATLLNLEFLRDEGLISGYNISSIPENIEDPAASRKLLESVRWLEQECPDPPRLSSRPLRDYMEDGLGTHYFSPVYADLARRRKHGFLHQGPETQIALYNSVIEHLAFRASSDKLQEVSWPITELSLEHEDDLLSDWNSPLQLAHLEQTILSLCLPEFDALDDVSDTWSDACADVWAYISAVVEDEGNNAQLYSRVRWLLTKAEKDFQQICQFVSREPGCKPPYISAPWADILLACVDHKLRNADYSDPAGAEDGVYRDLYVHTVAKDPDDFSPPSIWLDALAQVHTEDLIGVKDSVTHSVTTKRKREDTRSGSPPKQPRYETPPLVRLTPLTQDQLGEQETTRTLNTLLAVEKRSNRDYEDYLARVLNDDVTMADNSLANASMIVNISSMDTSVLWDDSSPEVSGILNVSTPRPSPGGAARRKTSLPSVWTPSMAAFKSRTDLDASGDAGSRSTLKDTLKLLNTSVETEKSADKMFELKLQSYLTEYPDFI